MAAESELEKECRQLALDAGGELPKWVSPGNKGVPDRLLLMPKGRIAFPEFKSPTGVLSPQQKRWLSRLNQLGFETAVIWELDQFKRLLASR